MIDRHQKILDLLDRHGEDLHRLIARLTRCEHTTRDLMQELFIKLSGSSSFEKSDHPYAYAWKAAANLAFQWRRRQKKWHQSLETLEFHPAGGDGDPEKAMRQEQLCKILEITASFGELGRHVIVMHYIEQLSYEEIAERLGKKPGYLRAVCSKHIHRLRVRLGRTLSEHTDREMCHE